MITERMVCSSNMKLGANKKVYDLKAHVPQEVEFADKAELDALKAVIPGFTVAPIAPAGPGVENLSAPATPPAPPPVPTTIPPTPQPPEEVDDSKDPRLPSDTGGEVKLLTGLKSMKKAELIKLCTDKGLDSKGTKPELVERLEALQL